MLIYILDEQFRKIDLLRKYTFSQYSDMFRDIGTFTINARIVNENLYLLDKDRQFYVLFDERLIGQVENVQRDSDSEYEKVIAITGKLSLVLFRNRVINGTLKFKGYTFEYVQELVRSQITADSGSKRYVPIDVGILGNEEYIASMREKCSVVDKQVTGGYIWDEIKAALEQDSLGLFFTPKGTDLVASTTDGIEQWALSISDGVDRTKGNTVGNTPVIFSQSLSNISRTTYIIDRQQYRNVAYVAGEGEDANRKWYEVYSSEEEETKSGWDRKELWIDARDIQSEDADGGTLTEEEYEEAIRQRANEKFVETKVNETYTATITEANKQYTYGVDYNKGDWVTVVDDELGIEIDVQITEVIKSVQGSQEIVDIGFTYGAIKRGTDEKVEQIESKVEQISNDIKYVENKTNTLMDEVNNKINEEVGKLFNAQELLWEGSLYMNESQRIVLPKPWTDFPHGIVLVWSAWQNGVAQDHQWNVNFLPKSQLDATRGGYSFLLIGTGDWMGWKYLYFESDNVTINGNEINDTSNTSSSSGIIWNNNHFALRRVYGV